MKNEGVGELNGTEEKVKLTQLAGCFG